MWIKHLFVPIIAFLRDLKFPNELVIYASYKDGKLGPLTIQLCNNQVRTLFM